MNEVVSKQAVYDALDNIKIPRNASWYQYYHQALTAVSKLPPVQSDLQPTCNQLATDAISRQAAIDAMCELMHHWFGGDPKDEIREIKRELGKLPSEQPATNCSEIPNSSDIVSRKVVREMVATWSYDMAEWEDVELALSDVDKLPSAHPEVIHCKDCKHYRTTGAFGVPLHKEEYFCDADNYPKNDSGEEQIGLPEWWFCAGAERKENE